MNKLFLLIFLISYCFADNPSFQENGLVHALKESNQAVPDWQIRPGRDGLVTFQETLAPLLRFSPEIPMEATKENRELSLQPEKNLIELEKTLFPWKTWIAILLTLLIFWKGEKGIQLLKTLFQQLTSSKDSNKEGLRQIKELQKRELIVQKQFDRFFGDLTKGVKKWIGERHGVKMTQLTTEEFIEKSSTFSDMNQQGVEKIKKLLEKADLVKFAQVHASAEDCQEAEQTVLSLGAGHK